MPKEDLPKPDPQNFANLSSLAEELGKTPDLDGKLRHLVPPAVRQMQEELKAMLQGVIQHEFSQMSNYSD